MYPISQLHPSEYYAVATVGHEYGSFNSTNCKLEKLVDIFTPKFSNFPCESRLIYSWPFNANWDIPMLKDSSGIRAISDVPPLITEGVLEQYIVWKR